MWKHRWCHRVWIFMLSQCPSTQARISESRPGQAGLSQGRTKTILMQAKAALPCITYRFWLNPKTQSTCNNGPEGKRGRVRTGSEFGQIWQYHLLWQLHNLDTQHRPGTVTGLLKRVKATIFLIFDIFLYSCYLAACVCSSLAGDLEPFRGRLQASRQRKTETSREDDPQGPEGHRS